MEDIAIIGMSCIFPGAPDVRTYWRNIVSRRNCIGDPPPDWEAGRYYDPSSASNDRIYCKKGGYLGSLATFDPFEFGVMPKSIDGGEPDHYLALRVANEALLDAGYDKDTINPEKSGVIIGRGTYINRGVTNLYQHGVVIDQTIDILRELNPHYSEDELKRIRKCLKDKLPPFTAETTPSLVPNVLAGRIANRLNLMGTNYIVDAACASSLVAIEHGMRDLGAHRYDLAIVGGVNAYIPPPILMIFCQINALSRKEELRAFDEAADGTLLGEGVGFVVLKRKSDALRDNDRIYAVLKSVGVASDGRVLGLLAPRVEGQALAMQRAYDEAKIAPSTIGLVEAHGTGVPMGDETELQSLRRVFGERDGRPSVALGTVKSMISHLIPAAGVAGLIKTSLALYHKVLPPTLCEKPNPKLEVDKTPFYINTETRPWIHGRDDSPRRAAVNAFGFGGINAHAILEEHCDSREWVNHNDIWATEAFLLGADTKEGLVREAGSLARFARAGGKEAAIKDIAYTLNSRRKDARYRLSLIASSTDDLAKKLEYAAGKLKDPECRRIRDRSGIYFFEEQDVKYGKTAFLFPGEGSQYADMLKDLCMDFPEVRSVFDLSDRAFIKRKREYLPSHTIFPLPLGQDSSSRLWAMDSAAESVFTANMAMLKMMELLGIKPDALCGHSTGEYNALLASGMLDIKGADSFVDFVLGVNSVYEGLASKGAIPVGILLSAGAADRKDIEEFVAGSAGRAWVAMENCPNQFVLCGPEEEMARAEAELKPKGVLCMRLPFSRAYHTPLFEGVSAALRVHFEKVKVKAPGIETYSCATASPFPNDVDGIRDLATSQWSRKVRFVETIEAMYASGVRTFIEVGPRGNLTAFVEDVLKKRPHLAIASNLHRRPGLQQLNELVCLMHANHVAMDPAALYRHRSPKKMDIEGTEPQKQGREKVKINTLLPRIELGKDAEQFRKAAPCGPVKPLESAPPLVDESPDGVMREYMRNMEDFLKGQQEVLKAFLGGPEKAAAPVGAKERAAAPPPVRHRFISEIVSATTDEAIAICRLDPKKDRFLLDHTLGRKVSDADASLTALPVVPLTFSMEILGAAGSLLKPGQKLVGMKEVRGYRWIGLDEGSRTLQAHAVLKGNGEVEVKLRDADPANPSAIRPGLPIVEGVMLFAPEYPKAPAAGSRPLKSARPSKWAGKDLYADFMFHGPSLQAVESMDEWGEDGSSAVIRAMPMEGLFSDPEVEFLSDPVALDAAGQVIAYWTSDHLESGFHIFPFRLEKLELFSPCMEYPEKVRCRARIELVGPDQVRSDIDLIDGSGLRYRLIGWWDKRFEMPESYYKLRASVVGNSLATPVEGLLPDKAKCMLIDSIPAGFLEGHDRIWERVLGHLVLSKREKEEFAALSGQSNRRAEWLLGRAAAKDAVRALIKETRGREILPADIEIVKAASGAPGVKIAGWEGQTPAISISHSGGRALAAAVFADGVGVDLEMERPLDKGFESGAFSGQELETLCSGGPLDNATMLRAWSAKEAAAKSAGLGLLGLQREIEITKADRAAWTFEVRIPAKLIDEKNDILLRAATTLKGGAVSAGVINNRSDKQHA